MRHALGEALAPAALVERADGPFVDREGFGAAPALVHGVSAVTTCRELGLAFEIDLVGAQKTGLFLDQREGHALVGGLAAGARVLDLHAYLGGFALNAARGGAARVLAVDASPRAVARAARAAAANGLAVETAEADAMQVLRAQPAGSWDLICLDPPKFARARKDLSAALNAHRAMHAAALKALAPGGLPAPSVSRCVSSAPGARARTTPCPPPSTRVATSRVCCWGARLPDPVVHLTRPPPPRTIGLPCPAAAPLVPAASALEVPCSSSASGACAAASPCPAPPPSSTAATRRASRCAPAAR